MPSLPSFPRVSSVHLHCNRDWGLRNARRTAFHAAVNYYCRQLGIMSYNSPIPVAFTDEDTLAFTATPADEDVEPPESPMAPEHADRKESKRVVLGFQAPPEDGIPSGMRPRRSKRSKKAMLSTFGEF